MYHLILDRRPTRPLAVPVFQRIRCLVRLVAEDGPFSSDYSRTRMTPSPPPSPSRGRGDTVEPLAPLRGRGQGEGASGRLRSHSWIIQFRDRGTFWNLET